MQFTRKPNTNSIIFITTILILIALLVYFTSDRSNKPYGNDEESIKKVITSIEGYENDSIEILEIKDINDIRVVGFLIDNNPAYIQFTKNQKGNYEWKHIEKNSNQSFASFLVRQSKDISNAMSFMIVTNPANDIAKMRLQVNEQEILQNFNIHEKSVAWIDLPDSKDGSYAFDYKYYDNEGNLIERN